MMKFLFIQKNAFPLVGIMSLSAVIKKCGWQVDLVLAGEEDIFNKINNFKPDIVGFCVFTGEHKWVLEQAKIIEKKYPKIILLVGGPHPTYYPDIINEKGIDGLIRGEAEGAIQDLICALDNNKSITKIKNLWFKKGKKIYKNSLRPLITNLDSLPAPDRKIYYQYSFLKNASVKQFLTGRGCPYDCSFCSNHILKKIYKGKGQYVRRYSPKRIIEEIKEIKSNYGFRIISFTDDLFIYDKIWLKKFLKIYKKEINVPFMCNVTANSLSDEIAKMLKKGGCYGIAMGVETGNENMRLRILNKNISNEQIINCGRIARKYQLELKTYNIFCLPGETFDQALETLKLNIRLKPSGAAASLLQPYPDYDITNYAIKNGYLKKDYNIEDVNESIYLPSVIKNKDSQRIANLQAFFPFLVAHPEFLPLIKPLLLLINLRLSRFIARLTYGYYLSHVHRLSFWDKVGYIRHIDPLKV
ncbi:MAG: radical SAM protein [Candidatus Gottesmanbacteria bacterium]